MTDTIQHPEELLPFYLNNTLSDTERQQVESHIASCDYCQHELTLLRTMQSVSRQQDDSVAQEFSWQRLKRDIKKHGQRSQPNNQWWKQAMATAAAIVIMVQAGFIFKMDSHQDGYSQAGQRDNSAIVQLKFNPNVREEQMRKILLEQDAEIIAGPSALGIYRVKLTLHKNDPEAEKKYKALKANSLLITYIARE